MQQRRQVDLRAAQHDRLQAWAGLPCVRARTRELPAQQRDHQRRAAQRCRQRTVRHDLHKVTALLACFQNKNFQY